MPSIHTCGALTTPAAVAPGRVMLMPLNLPSQQIGRLDSPARLAISEAAFSFPPRS
jgi:hypothetical protein